MSSRNNQGCGCFGCFSSLIAIMIILPLLFGGFLYIGLFALAIWLIYIMIREIWRLIKNIKRKHQLRKEELRLQQIKEDTEIINHVLNGEKIEFYEQEKNIIEIFLDKFKLESTRKVEEINNNLLPYEIPKKICSHCGNIERMDYKYCANCGHHFSRLSKKQSQQLQYANQMQCIKSDMERKRRIRAERELSEIAMYEAQIRNAQLKKQDNNDNLKQYNDLMK